MRSIAQCLIFAFWLNPLVRLHFLFKEPAILNYKAWILGMLAFEVMVIGMLASF